MYFRHFAILFPWKRGLALQLIKIDFPRILCAKFDWLWRKRWKFGTYTGRQTDRLKEKLIWAWAFGSDELKHTESFKYYLLYLSKPDKLKPLRRKSTIHVFSMWKYTPTSLLGKLTRFWYPWYIRNTLDICREKQTYLYIFSCLKWLERIFAVCMLFLSTLKIRQFEKQFQWKCIQCTLYYFSSVLS